MARLREVYSIPDLSFFDEPVLIAGPLVLTWRRILYLFPLILVGLVLRMPSKMPIQGFPLGLDQIIIMGFATALAILGLAPRRAVPIEQQLLGIFSSGPRKRKKRPQGPRELVIKTDVIPYTLEISGYAVDPRTGNPLDTVVVITVDGETIEVVPDKNGRYRAVVELGPGLHSIEVVLKEPPLKLKELKVRVLEK